MYWWVALGYPNAFDLGKDGIFPRSGQVVKYYRERKKDDKGRAWTQNNLATTLGVTETMIRNIENKDAGMSFERRQFLSNLFGIPPILLGIITKDQIDQLLKEKGIILLFPPSQHVAVPTHQLTIDVKEYREQLNRLWFTKINQAAHGLLPVALTTMDALYRELPHISQERPQIQSLLCDYHQFIANLLADQRHYDAAIESLDKASGFAKMLEDEKKALVFKRKGNILFLANRIEDAVLDFERAWQFEKKLSNNFRGSILLEAGRAKARNAARTAKTKKDRKKIIDEIDLVGKIIRANYNEEDPHLFKLDLDCYHGYKSDALVAIGWNKEAIEELKLIKGSQYPLRQVACDILQAQAYVNTGEYSEAAKLTEPALLTAQELHSELNIARIAGLFQQLKQSSYKDSADVARLEYLLYYKPRT
jgi:transcriptional regulator with XRE-family HTH domain